VVPATGYVYIDGCGDGRRMTDDGWRVNDGEAVKGESCAAE